MRIIILKEYDIMHHLLQLVQQKNDYFSLYNDDICRDAHQNPPPHKNNHHFPQIL